MKCHIIDDEPLARKGIKELVESFPGLEYAGESNNPIEAMNNLSQLDVDLLFLDIKMPRMNGIDFLKQISSKYKVILTTAYTEYITEAFNLKAENYLLKPIDEMQFNNSISNLMLKSSNQEQQEAVNEKALFIKNNGQFVKINIDDILFVKSIQNYIKIFLSDQTILCHKTLKSIEDALPSNQFLRVQKSFLVNMERVESFENNIVYIDKHIIPISRKLGTFFKSNLMNKAIIL